MRRIMTTAMVGLMLVLTGGQIAEACGFLVSANGAVRLGRTATFVAWENGIERYITNFNYEGDAESFGSLVPLPAEPTDVRRAGDWTLQRLQREVQPQGRQLVFAADAATSEGAEVLFRTRIDSLDVVVLRGGGADVLTWVNENGFELPPGPETDHMLDFYASRSPYFLAARFDAEAAGQDGFVSGDGIPVQITVPTPRPWVPLHILHGAVPDSQVIEADVFLLTPERPDLLHGEGLTINRSEPATDLLLDDLRSDENMEWIPDRGWFTHLALETDASNIVYDLSVGVDATGTSFVDAGLTRFEPSTDQLHTFGLEPASPPWREPLVVVGVALLAGITGAALIAAWD